MATTCTLSIFTLFLIALVVSADLILNRGAINIDLQNKACVASDVVFTSGAHSKLECFVQCAQNEACRGIFYGGVGQCMGCSEMYTSYNPNSLPGQTGTAFYGRSLKYGDNCASSYECMQPNMQCKSNACKCQPGYPYLQATGACVETCGTYGYGNTYETWTSYKLSGYEMFHELHKIDPAWCYASCNNNDGCRGFDWVSFGVMICYYKNGVSNSLTWDGNVVHHTRNCA